MSVNHPTWCIGTEDEGEDHTSRTLCAAMPTDVIDIRLRLTQPAEEPDDVTMWTTLVLEFVEDDKPEAYPLGPDQARLFIDRLNEIMPSGPIAATSGGMPAWLQRLSVPAST